MDYTTIESYTEETIQAARNLIAAKQVLDNAKKLYDAARKTFLLATGDYCYYHSADKSGAIIEVDSQKVIAEPRLKLGVFDYDKVPLSVQPYLSVTEIVNISSRGKVELDNYLTANYGPVDYEHPQSKEFFSTLGINSGVSKVVSVKNSGGPDKNLSSE